MTEPTTTPTPAVSLDQLCINSIRILSIDAIQAANSGHPGAPMGLAPAAYVLWTRHLRHDPAHPDWPDRDRFVLSCGHASMLLYSLLYLSGYDLSLDDLKAFRQVGSRTPGHPEVGRTPGVETTTGPLGQGFANAVGMAMAEAQLAATFNRSAHPLVDHRTYFFASDGDLMEGISQEAASLAGHWGLGKLIGLYDANRITIDGSIDLAYSDDVATRFGSLGWQVIRVSDGNDIEAIDAAYDEAKGETSRPSLIIARTHIGFGSPHKQGTAAAHGAPLGEEEVRLTRERLDWPEAEPFAVPEEALTAWRACERAGAARYAAWEARRDAYARAFPAEAVEFERRLERRLPAGWDDGLPRYAVADGTIATRKASGQVLNALVGRCPELIGGSADLSGSVNTLLAGESAFSREDRLGREMFFGIREHGMGGIMNGMILHGGLRPFGGTFLIFSDYMRPAIRLAAMMGQPTVYLFSHDSIGLGEDGPTHQPIETLSALRAIPNLVVLRPADANETVEAWRVAMTHRRGPVALVLSRQGLPVIDRSRYASPQGVVRGGYVLSDPAEGPARAIIMASGSEVALAIEAADRLSERGCPVRVVNLASHELFAHQSPDYRDSVLPPSIGARLAVEAAHPMSWYQWVGGRGAVMGIETFGASGPGPELFARYGFTVERVVDRVLRLVER